MGNKKGNRKNEPIDYTLLFVTLLLVFIGVIMVFSSSWPDSIKKFNDEYYFFKKQLISAIIGTFVMFLFTKLPYRILDKWAPLIYIGSLALGALIFTPLGVERNGARRWLNLFGLQFMPSDVMKLASIIFIASKLRKKKNFNSFFKDLLPILIYIAIPCLIIILQKDLSTTVTLGLSLVSMVFVAGIKLLHILLIAVAGISFVILAILDPRNKYRLARLTKFMDPFENMSTTGWQASQSLMALGSGGILGTGLGKSRQKFAYLPEAHNDFIFAIIGEELGLIGGLSVLLLLTVLVIRGMRVAVKARDPFGRYLATGITTLIIVQSLINIGVVTSILPPTGLPLPFISYGGTSLIVNMASMGILLNISRYSR